MAAPLANPAPMPGENPDELRLKADEIIDLRKQKNTIEGTIPKTWLGRCWSGRKGAAKQEELDQIKGKISQAVTSLKDLVAYKVKIIVVEPPVENAKSVPLTAHAVQSMREICDKMQKEIPATDLTKSSLEELAYARLMILVANTEDPPFIFRQILALTPYPMEAPDKIAVLTKLAETLERIPLEQRTEVLINAKMLVQGSSAKKERELKPLPFGNSYYKAMTICSSQAAMRILDKIKYLGPDTFLIYTRQLNRLGSLTAQDLENFATILRHVPEEKRSEIAAKITESLLTIPQTAERAQHISLILEMAVKLLHPLNPQNKNEPASLINALVVALKKTRPWPDNDDLAEESLKGVYADAQTFLKRIDYKNANEIAELFSILSSIRVPDYRTNFIKRVTHQQLELGSREFQIPGRGLLKKIEGESAATCNALLTLLQTIHAESVYGYQEHHKSKMVAFLGGIKGKANLRNVLEMLKRILNAPEIYGYEREKLYCIDRAMSLIQRQHLPEEVYTTIFKLADKCPRGGDLEAFDRAITPYLEALDTLEAKHAFIDTLSLYPQNEWEDVLNMYLSLMEKTGSIITTNLILQGLQKIEPDRRAKYFGPIDIMITNKEYARQEDVNNFLRILLKSKLPDLVVKMITSIPPVPEGQQTTRLNLISNVLLYAKETSEVASDVDPSIPLKILTTLPLLQQRKFYHLILSIPRAERKSFLYSALRLHLKTDPSFLDVLSVLKDIPLQLRVTVCDKFLAYIQDHRELPVNIYPELLQVIEVAPPHESESLRDLLEHPIFVYNRRKRFLYPSLNQSLIKKLATIPAEYRIQALEISNAFARLDADHLKDLQNIIDAIANSPLHPNDWQKALDFAVQHFRPADLDKKLDMILFMFAKMPENQRLDALPAFKKNIKIEQSVTQFVTIWRMLTYIPPEKRLAWLNFINTDAAQTALSLDGNPSIATHRLLREFHAQDPKNHDEMNAHLIKELDAPDQRAARRLAILLIDDIEAGVLEWVYEQHPIEQRAIRVRAQTEMDMDNPKNPYQLYVKLQDIAKSEKLLNRAGAVPIKTSVNDQQKVVRAAVNLEALRQLSPDQGYTFAQCPMVLEDFFETFCQRFEARLASLTAPQREVLRREMENAFEVESFASIREVIGMGQAIPKLMRAKGAPQDRVENPVYHLRHIVQAISQEINQRPPNALFSPQEEMCLKFLSQLKGICTPGQEDRMAIYYKNIAPAAPGQPVVELGDVEKVQRTLAIKEMAQTTRDDIFYSSHVLKDAADYNQNEEVPQLSHQTRLLLNRFSKQLGIPYSIAFDISTGVIIDKFLACTQAIDLDTGEGAVAKQVLDKLLNNFIKELIKQIKEKVAKSFKDYPLIQKQYTEALSAYNQANKPNSNVSEEAKQALKSKADALKEKRLTLLKFDNLSEYFSAKGIKHADNQWTDLFAYGKDAEGNIDYEKLEGITDTAALEILKKENLVLV